MIAYNGTQTIFDRAILQSGAYVSFHDTFNATEQAAAFTKVATAVGCTGADVMTCLRSVAAANLTSATSGINWRPVVDGKLFSESTMAMTESGKGMDIQGGPCV